jgi:ATP-dependent Clp protease ATP-binding subunit ClpA
MVVFKPLGTHELQKILDIELHLVQQRIFNNDAGRRFIFSLTDAGKDFLLSEGTDVNYGARHLKRAIARLLVQPLSTLIASNQIRYGDLIRIDHCPQSPSLAFHLEEEGLMARGHVQTSRSVLCARCFSGGMLKVTLLQTEIHLDIQ